MTNFGQLVYMQKPKQLSKLITNGSNKEKTKRIEQFPKNPGIEYKANTVPKNTGIPGFCKNTVPYRTGMKFLIPLGPVRSPHLKLTPIAQEKGRQLGGFIADDASKHSSLSLSFQLDKFLSF